MAADHVKRMQGYQESKLYKHINMLSAKYRQVPFACKLRIIVAFKWIVNSGICEIRFPTKFKIKLILDLSGIHWFNSISDFITDN